MRVSRRGAIRNQVSVISSRQLVFGSMTVAVMALAPMVPIPGDALQSLARLIRTMVQILGFGGMLRCTLFCVRGLVILV
jgi:hypothetical protein